MLFEKELHGMEQRRQSKMEKSNTPDFLWQIRQNPEDGSEFINNPRHENFCKHALRYCHLLDDNRDLIAEVRRLRKELTKCEKISELRRRALIVRGEATDEQPS